LQYAKTAEIFLFADDAKLVRHIIRADDSEKLQQGCNRVEDWLLKLNVD